MNLFVECQHQYPTGFRLDAQFEVHEQLAALFGPSGSGKTTILQLVAGLLRPDSGRIRIGDQVVTDIQAGIFVRPEDRRVGLVFQDHCLFPHLRVNANLAYGQRRRGRPRIPWERVVRTLELTELLDRYPRSLSGGQQQRVALGRAILAGPRLLLLDEPVSSVELALRDRIADFIERAVHEFQIPTLLVSHDGELVERLANQVVRIAGGRVPVPTEVPE